MKKVTWGGIEETARLWFGSCPHSPHLCTLLGLACCLMNVCVLELSTQSWSDLKDSISCRRRCHEIVGRQFVSVAASGFSKSKSQQLLAVWMGTSPLKSISYYQHEWAVCDFSYRTNLFFFPELRPLKCCRGRWGCRGSSTNGPVGMGWGKPAWNGKKEKACEADALSFVISELSAAALCAFWFWAKQRLRLRHSLRQERCAAFFGSVII